MSPRYPLTELACGLWALAAYERMGLSPAFPLVALWGFLLVALFWIDLDFQLLPDVLTFPGTLVGIGAALLGASPRHAMLGMLFGAGLLWLVAELYFRIRKIEGLGGGDVKLAAMFGAVLGGPLAVLTIFLAAFAGSLWALVLMLRGRADGRTALPFGTFLAPAAMVAFLWGDLALRWYLGLLR